MRFENDANCFALSEATDGAGAGHRVVFGAILGTGAGAGIVIEGRLLRGAHALAGEWGHNPLPWMAARRISRARAATAAATAASSASSPARPCAEDHERATGERLAPADIVAAAQAGTPPARASLERHEHRLGRALAHVVNLIDPDVIVLGGGLSQLESLYASLPARHRGVRLRARLARRSSARSTAIRAGCAGRRCCGPPAADGDAPARPCGAYAFASAPCSASRRS